jgi:hypothetical protein
MTRTFLRFWPSQDRRSAQCKVPGKITERSKALLASRNMGSSHLNRVSAKAGTWGLLRHFPVNIRRQIPFSPSRRVSE